MLSRGSLRGTVLFEFLSARDNGRCRELTLHLLLSKMQLLNRTHFTFQRTDLRFGSDKFLFHRSILHFKTFLFLGGRNTDFNSTR